MFTMKIGIFVAGFKGLNFLETLSLCIQTNLIEFVCSYPNQGNASCTFTEIQTLCSIKNYNLYSRKVLDRQKLDAVEIIFVVGWQFIIDNTDDRYIIFHDSILPKYRGFAPTVTALINGDRQIGVTALKASNLADRGDVYDQKVIEIDYPIKIYDAYLLLGKAYTEIAISIIDKASQDKLVAIPQSDLNATYSLWRDEEDYYINWEWSANKILRFINAVGYPYGGARTNYQSQVIYIDEVVVTEDVFFEDRHSGKIWNIKNGHPEVVCGQGMIQILIARFEDGTPVKFNKLRTRLGLNFNH
jgi:methionyl-tRNA formyltransferase